MMPMTLRCRTLALCAALALLAPCAFVQEQPPPPRPPATAFVQSIEVRVVEVEVFVNDRDGNPATGLTREDFEILENGRPVPLTNFYAVEGGKVLAPPATPPGEEPAPPAPPPPKEKPLSLVIYVDNVNIHPFHRKRVFAALRDFIRSRLEPDDRLMLVAYDRVLNLHALLTTDHLRILSLLDELEGEGGDRPSYESERKDMLEMIAEAQSYAAISTRVENYAESVLNDLRFSIDALSELIGYLAGIQGRKALLYVSDGLPMKPAEEMFYAIDQRFPMQGSSLKPMEYDATRRFEEIVQLANANRVTLYAIDAAGQRSLAGASAEERGNTFSSAVEDLAARNLQSSLHYLARNTGGQSFTNTNDMDEALRRIAADFQTYYSLGYRPGHRDDGQYYRVDVRVKRPGLAVRRRQGFRDQTAAGRLEEGIVSALVLGYEENPLGIDLQVGQGRAAEEKGIFVVPLEVRIPLGKLLFLPQEGGVNVARLQVGVAARDTAGGISPVQQSSLPIEVPQTEMEGALGKHYTYELQLLMRRGGQLVAVGVRDELSSDTSFVIHTAAVGE